MEYDPYIASNNLNNPGSTNTFASIKGITKKKGIVIQAIVYLINPLTQSILKIQTDQSGQYVFKGLPKGQEFLVFARDPSRKYNAVIQDNVVPK